jgi:hypothetical protein
MRPSRRTPLLLTAALLLLPVTTSGQTVRGRVVGELDDRPIAQAHVAVLAGAGAGVIASRLSADGSFLFDLPDAGSYHLRVEALGYFPLTTEPLDVPARTVISLELRLRTDAIALEPVRVVGERPEPPFMQDVRRRHGIGFGRLITREQLDERFGSLLQDVLRDAGLRITEVRDGLRVFPLVTARLTATASRNCFADLYLNGLRQYTFGTTEYDGEQLERAWELFQFRPQDIEAVEIYRGAAEIPAEYSGSTAQCGVVAVWLRSGYETMPVGDGDLYTGPLPQVTLNAAGARYTLNGRHTPARGTAYEAAAYWRVRGGAGIGAGIGVRTRYGAHELSAETARELMRGTRIEEPGPRPLSVVMLGIEPRIVLFERRPVRPVLAGRIAVARRRFEVPNPRLPRARPAVFTSHAWGWGGAAGAELALLRGVSLEGTVSYERLHFGAYEALETRSKNTASDWRTTMLRVGLAKRL